MMKFIKDLFGGLLYLFFPQNCALCQSDALAAEQLICFECLPQLPKTNFCNIKNNPVEQIFNGRIKFENAAAFLYYSKGNHVKILLHEIKYNNNQDLAIYLGKLIGNDLKQSIHFKDIDAILPMPIHEKKLFKRGYNQALLLAQGLAEEMKIPIENKLVKKVKNIDSQTQKSKIERIENVMDIFKINDFNCKYQHLLLVDDVVTTGASLDILANEILKQYPEMKISIACLALTQV